MTTSMQVHKVMQEKGFWDPDANRLDYVRAKTFMQICHLLIEYMEAVKAWREERNLAKTLEERADICIVGLDLLGSMGQDLELESLYEVSLGTLSISDLPEMIAELANGYRKTGVLSSVLLDIIRVALGPEAMNVVLFVERKMEINRQRPRLYGVKGASCQEEKAK